MEEENKQNSNSSSASSDYKTAEKKIEKEEFTEFYEISTKD